MSDDLIAFLRARLAEDEQIARAATSGPWEARPVVYGPADEGWGPPDLWEIAAGQVTVVGHQMHEGGGVYTVADARHIAGYDPARVLREVEARRRVVELCEPPLIEVTNPLHGERSFLPGQGAPWGEPVLRLLALPYADHPDYRQEWRP